MARDSSLRGTDTDKRIRHDARALVIQRHPNDACGHASVRRLCVGVFDQDLGYVRPVTVRERTAFSVVDAIGQGRRGRIAAYPRSRPAGRHRNSNCSGGTIGGWRQSCNGGVRTRLHRGGTVIAVANVVCGPRGGRHTCLLCISRTWEAVAGGPHLLRAQRGRARVYSTVLGRTIRRAGSCVGAHVIVALRTPSAGDAQRNSRIPRKGDRGRSLKVPEFVNHGSESAICQPGKSLADA